LSDEESPYIEKISNEDGTGSLYGSLESNEIEIIVK
jgi:hypothetical protein